MRPKAYLLLVSVAVVCNCRFDYEVYSGAAASIGGANTWVSGIGSSAATASGGAGSTRTSSETSGGTSSFVSAAGGSTNLQAGASSVDASGGSAINTGGVPGGGTSSTGGTVAGSGGGMLTGGTGASGGTTATVTGLGGAGTIGGSAADAGTGSFGGGSLGGAGGDTSPSGGGGTSATGGTSLIEPSGGTSADGGAATGAAGNGGSAGASLLTGGTAGSDTGIGSDASTNETLLVVTTHLDESDSYASPSAPGGSGFSLREAITYANQTAGAQTIQVPTGFSIALTGMLPELLDAAGVTIVGDGAVLDGSGFIGFNPCLRISSDNNRVTGLEITGCARAPVEIASGQNNQLDHLDVYANGREISVASAGNRIGPDNTIATSGNNGITLTAPTTVDHNWIVDNANMGILFSGTADGSRVIGNVLARNQAGFDVGTNCDNVVFHHNVIDSNASYGGTITANVTGTDFQANLVTSNGGRGISGFDGSYAVRDYNDWWNNVGEACSGCAALGAHDLTVDPLYVDAAAGDYHLMSASPVRDAAPELGVDTNGAEPGNFWILPPMGPFDVQP